MGPGLRGVVTGLGGCRRPVDRPSRLTTVRPGIAQRASNLLRKAPSHRPWLPGYGRRRRGGHGCRSGAEGHGLRHPGRGTGTCRLGTPSRARFRPARTWHGPRLGQRAASRSPGTTTRGRGGAGGASTRRATQASGLGMVGSTGHRIVTRFVPLGARPFVHRGPVLLRQLLLPPAVSVGDPRLEHPLGKVALHSTAAKLRAEAGSGHLQQHVESGTSV